MPNVRSPEAAERHRIRRNIRRSERRQAQRIADDNGYVPRPRIPAGKAARKAHMAAAKVKAAARRRELAAERRDARPFIGCDGEGTNNNGVFDYALFRIGDRELFKGGRRLTTPELLTFILASPPSTEAILSGFAFEYDNSNILRDVPMAREHEGIPSRMERLLDRDRDRFRDPWTWLNFDGYRQFGVGYLPRKYLKVCYAQPRQDGKPGFEAVPGSTRIIQDSFGFFQKSFLRSLSDWGIGSERDLKLIDAGKAGRDGFKTITREIRAYNKLECERLSEMMTSLREATRAADIHLGKWDGAGRIAHYMLKRHGMLRRVDLEKRLQKGLWAAAHAAYYGGRFEVARIGNIDEPVTECDIGSAYPAALLEAPCHIHGKWRMRSAAHLQKMLRLPNDIFVAPVRFHHPKSSFWCGIPFRPGTGILTWPRDGRGTYWSVELRSARKLGAQIEIEGPGWVYERRCDCVPYHWLATYYEARKRLGKAHKGIPLKLGMNAVPGKLMQRVGGAPWQNPIDAGLLTATTRAKLNLAIAAAGDTRRIVMVATDAIYYTGRKRVPLPGGIGAGLGQWETKRHASIFIVKPGVYWPPPSADWKVKTRGIKTEFLRKAVPRFHAAWRAYMKRRREREPPAVSVQARTFIGLRLAMHLKKYDRACHWVSLPVRHSFDWQNKRDPEKVETVRRSLLLGPLPGDPDLRSTVYTPAVRAEWYADGAAPSEQTELVLDTVRDAVDLHMPNTF